MTRQVSVIIPAINEADAIGAAIDSALSAGADEVILADGGSSDATVETARAGGAQVVASVPGRALQQNAGARQASGDVLLFLHADCCLPDSALQELRQHLAQVPSCAGGCFGQRIDDPRRVYRWIESGNQLRARMLKWAYGDQAIFVRADVFHRIGGFPEIALMEDLYFMKRLKREGGVVCLDSRVLVSARRWQERGTVTQTLRNWTMLLAVHFGVSPARLARHYPRTT